MDKQKLMRFLLTVVDHGSYSAAARQMATSPSTVSKAIVRLEQSIGIQIFHRSTRQLRLTSEGEQYANKIRTLLDQLESCEKEIKQRNDMPIGRLRVNVPVSYGRLYIRPLLKPFSKLYPDIKIELSYNDKYIDIIEQNFDLSIRSGTLADSRLVVRQLSPIDFLICAAPSYIKKKNFPNSAREFDQHQWIRFRYQQTNHILPIMMPKHLSHTEFDPDQSYIVDDGEAMAELCAEGLGLTQTPHFIAKKWLNNRSIVPIFPAFSPHGHGVFLVYPKRDFLSERVKVFISFLSKQIESMGETPIKTWAHDIKIWNTKD